MKTRYSLIDSDVTFLMQSSEFTKPLKLGSNSKEKKNVKKSYIFSHTN